MKAKLVFALLLLGGTVALYCRPVHAPSQTPPTVQFEPTPNVKPRGWPSAAAQANPHFYYETPGRRFVNSDPKDEDPALPPPP